MKKEIVISIIIIIFVIVGNIITQNYTKQCVAKINEQLIDLKQESIKKEKDEKNEKNENNENNENKLEEKIKVVEDDWDEMQERLAFYIEHDELEKVETQLFILKGNIESGLYKEMLPEIEKCAFILEHIEDKTTLNIKNIF